MDSHVQVSERVFRHLDHDLGGEGRDLPASLTPLQSRLQQTAGPHPISLIAAHVSRHVVVNLIFHCNCNC